MNEDDIESAFWGIAAEVSKDAYFMHALNEIIDEEGPEGASVANDDPDDDDDDGPFAFATVTVDEERLEQLEEAWSHVLHHNCEGGRHVMLQWSAGVLMELRESLSDESDDEWDPDDPLSWL